MGTCTDRAIHLLNLPRLVNQITDTFGIACRGIITCPVGQAECAVRIAQEQEGKIKLLGKGSILSNRIKAHPEDFNILGLEVCNVVTEPATFGRSTGSICLWIEPQ